MKSEGRPAIINTLDILRDENINNLRQENHWNLQHVPAKNNTFDILRDENINNLRQENNWNLQLLVL